MIINHVLKQRKRERERESKSHSFGRSLQILMDLNLTEFDKDSLFLCGHSDRGKDLERGVKDKKIAQSRNCGKLRLKNIFGSSPTSSFFNWEGFHLHKEIIKGTLWFVLLLDFQKRFLFDPFLSSRDSIQERDRGNGQADLTFYFSKVSVSALYWIQT